jgi:hypothetical protein
MFFFPDQLEELARFILSQSQPFVTSVGSPNHLCEVLPGGARVGTVDKLQGQEAAVDLISMTTSSGDDMPRNIEFLYSQNRLNVAISRARRLSVVFASPRLLEIPCTTIEQMQLVNTLCWAKHYSDQQVAAAVSNIDSNDFQGSVPLTARSAAP